MIKTIAFYCAVVMLLLPPGSVVFAQSSATEPDGNAAPASDPVTQSIGTTTTATAPATRPATLPASSGEYKLRYKTVLDGHKVDMAYLLFLPKIYDTSKDRVPMVVFLHGAGECGTDCAGLKVHGPPMELDKPTFHDNCPFAILAPQCPPHGQRWDQPEMIKATVALLDEVCAKTRIDRDRVYLTGLSMGGKGTWLVASEAPDRFAAIAPLAADVPNPDQAPELLKYTPIWWSRGQSDEGAGDEKVLLGRFKDSKAELRTSILPGVDHGCWPFFYENAEFYEWLLTHRRLNDWEKDALEDHKAPAAWPAENPGKEPGHYLLQTKIKINDGLVAIRYSLYLPPGYATDKPPVILYLHEPLNVAAALAGTTMTNAPTAASALCVSGPELEIARPQSPLKDHFPFIVISPKLPPMQAWDKAVTLLAVKTLLTQTIATLKADPDRVYITGVNSGGSAAWMLARQNPGMFAAAVIMMSDRSFTLDPPELLKTMPLCACLPSGDTAALQGIADLMSASNRDSMLVTFEKGKTALFTAHYANLELYLWLLKHKVSDAQ